MKHPTQNQLSHWVAQNFQRMSNNFDANLLYMWYVKYLHGPRFKNLVACKCLGKFKGQDNPGLFFFVNWTLVHVGIENRQGFLTTELGFSSLSSLVSKEIKVHKFCWWIQFFLAIFGQSDACKHTNYTPHTKTYTKSNLVLDLYSSYVLVKVQPMQGLPFQPWAVGSTSHTLASPSRTSALIYKPKIWKDTKGKRFLANFKQCGPMWAP